MKKIFIITFAVLVVLVGALFGIISIATYKPTVAFYNLDERSEKAIKKELATFIKEGGKPLKMNLITLDPSIPLSNQKEVKKAKVIFASLDADISEFVQTNRKIVGQPAEILNGVPSTTRASALVKDGGLLVVPLLYDFVQIDVLREVFENSGMENLVSLEDLKDLAQFSKESLNFPIVFSGKDDATMVDVFGAFVESVCGAGVFEDASAKLYSAFKSDYKANDTNFTALNQTLQALIEEDGALYPAVKEFRECRANGLIAYEGLNMTTNDMVFFMENKLCAAVINTLSQHRMVNNRAANNFATIYMPAPESRENRSFQARQICAFAQTKNKNFTSVLNLLSSSRQSSLSMTSSLAPTLSNCAASDRQSDDVRYWIAASDGPLMPMSQYLPSARAKAVAADLLRAYLK